MESIEVQELLESLLVILGKCGGDLTAALSRVDTAAGSTGGELGHYLQRRSYQKAYALLEAGANPEHGYGAH